MKKNKLYNEKKINYIMKKKIIKQLNKYIFILYINAGINS